MGLKKKAKEFDEVARELQEAFQGVKQAHTESNCSNVAHNAKEDGQEPPQCAVEWKEANKDIKSRQLLAIPTCETGAATLTGLKDSSISTDLGLFACILRVGVSERLR